MSDLIVFSGIKPGIHSAFERSRQLASRNFEFIGAPPLTIIDHALLSQPQPGQNNTGTIARYWNNFVPTCIGSIVPAFNDGYRVVMAQSPLEDLLGLLMRVKDPSERKALIDFDQFMQRNTFRKYGVTNYICINLEPVRPIEVLAQLKLHPEIARLSATTIEMYRETRSALLNARFDRDDLFTIDDHIDDDVDVIARRILKVLSSINLRDLPNQLSVMFGEEPADKRLAEAA